MITSFKTEGLDIGFDFDIDLEKDKPIYCFIGKNGIGKTQLLENMAKALIFSHSTFRKQDSNLKYSGLYNKTAVSFNSSIKLPLIIEINKTKIFAFDLIKINVLPLGSIGLCEKIVSNFVIDKPLIFVGAKNRGFTKNIDTNNIKILSDKESRFVESFKRTLKYINSEGLEREEVADWFASRLIINPNFITQSQNKIYEAATVLKLIDRLEPNLNLVTKTEQGEKLDVSFYEGKLLINNIPLDKLSTGYVSIIKIFQEIVAGYGGWTDVENLNEVEGIVFIDELEPHLHISWQTKIIKILREFFPKTTFYISTHSPLVLAGLKDGEGYELVREGDIVKSKRIANIENYFLNDIVREFFDVDLNQQRIDNVDKEKQKKAKALLLNIINSVKDDEQ